MAEDLHSVREKFQKRFGKRPDSVVIVPARINLIGEHTDYNDGFVLPVAIDMYMYIAAAENNSGDICAYSDQYREEDRFSILKEITHSKKQWSNYLRAVVATFRKHDYSIGGFDCLITSDIPQGAGLSSSAAYEVGVAALLSHFYKLWLNRTEIALLAHESEHDFIGVHCGIMDQFICALGEKDKALFIDCRSQETRLVDLALPEDVLCFVVVHSGVKRGLVDSKYNERRQQCADGLVQSSTLLKRKIASFRDLTPKDLVILSSSMDETLFKRVKHVVNENCRVQATLEALEKKDWKLVGQLVNSSHASLSDVYEVSCPQVDTLVELTQKHPGTLGARIIGAGFGGCVLAIMQVESVNSYIEKVLPQYKKATGLTPIPYVARSADCLQVHG